MKKMIWTMLTAALLIQCFAAAGQRQVRFDYREKTLGNGLTVITLEDFSCPIVAVQVWYGVGSKNEDPQRQGYAHLFEHMMFKGTDIVGSKEHFERIRQAGGWANGYTGFDRTVYEQTLPAGQIELALWLEAERMSFLKIDQEAFDTERKVVEEELRMNENEPYGNVFKKLAGHIFKEHPYRWTPIGKIAHLRATSVPEIRSFWQRYYVPNNATLIIVGAVKHSDAQKLAQKYFGWIKPGPAAPKVTVREPLPEKPQRIEIDDENAPAGLAGFVWRTVPLGSADQVALDFAAEILGGQKSSRLYRKLVAEGQIAVDTASWTYNLQQDGIFMAGAMLGPSCEYDKALEVIGSEIERIKKEGVSLQELEKARNQGLKEFVTSNLEIESKARLLGEGAVTIGDAEYVNRLEERIRSVTAEDIKRVAGKYLNADRAFIVTVRQNPGGMAAAGKDSELAEITAEPEKQAPPPGRPGEKRPKDWPKTAPLGPVKAEKIDYKRQEKALKNGLKVFIVPNNEVPFLSVKLGMPSGAFTEDTAGAANLAMQMLTNGTKNYSEGELAAELERYAIALSGRADMDSSTVEMNCLSEQAERGMSLLGEVLREPTFDPNEFEKLRRQALMRLSVQEQSPEYLAGREFAGRLYGEHPYGRMPEGSSESISSIKANQLKNWWRQNARPAQAVLIFAGDIEPQRAFELAQRYLGNWKVGAERRPVELPQMPAIKGRRIYLVDRPGAVQVQICVGERSITRRQQPEYFVSRVVTNYFGGSFNSRVNDTLRIRQGLTYAAWGYYNAQRFDGTFQVETFTKNESAARAIEAVLELIDGLGKEGPSVEELDNSKRYLIGSFILYRQTPQQLAEDLWLTELEGLGRDYFDRLLEGVAQTTAQDCLELVKKTIEPRKMVIVAVGDAAKIKSDLEKIAPVTVIAGRTP